MVSSGWVFGVGLVLGDGALACVDAEGAEGGLDLVDAVLGGEHFGVHAHAGVGAVVVFVTVMRPKGVLSTMCCLLASTTP